MLQLRSRVELVRPSDCVSVSEPRVFVMWIACEILEEMHITLVRFTDIHDEFCNRAVGPNRVWCGHRNVAHAVGNESVKLLLLVSPRSKLAFVDEDVNVRSMDVLPNSNVLAKALVVEGFSLLEVGSCEFRHDATSMEDDRCNARAILVSVEHLGEEVTFFGGVSLEDGTSALLRGMLIIERGRGGIIQCG